MKLFITISFAFVTLAFFSCQKEIMYEETPTSNFADSNYLHKIYLGRIDSSTLYIDTFEIQTFKYDNSRRVVSRIDSSNDNPVGMLPYVLTKYFYNGSDSLPHRMEIYRSNPNWPLSHDTTITFYTYNAAGRNIYDSSIISEDFNTGTGSTYEKRSVVQSYQYDGNNIYCRAFYSHITGNGSSQAYSEMRDTAITDIRGNVISSKRYGIDAGQNILLSTSDFTYDNNPSPFARMSNFRTLTVVPFGETFLYDMQGTNNRLRASESSTMGGSYHEDLTGKYSYNPHGYPVRIFYPDPFSSQDYYFISFTYKSL